MNLAFVQIKVFGDLTMAASSLRRLAPEARAQCSLLIGPHLSSLCELLAPECRVDVLDIQLAGNAALFDIRNQGLVAALGTARKWRSALAVKAPGSTLVFDRLTLRENFVRGRREAVALPDVSNIYVAYDRFLEERFSKTSLLPRPALRFASRTVGIFPISRIAAKSIPSHLVDRMARQCREKGFEPVVFLLEGERLDVTPNVERRLLPRTFAALIGAIDGLGAVVSADSLPAHLSEYYDRPVFVASPVPNSYWLPASSFEKGDWGLFTEVDGLVQALGRFLTATASS